MNFASRQRCMYYCDIAEVNGAVLTMGGISDKVVGGG